MREIHSERKSIIENKLNVDQFKIDAAIATRSLIGLASLGLNKLADLLERHKPQAPDLSDLDQNLYKIKIYAKGDRIFRVIERRPMTLPPGPSGNAQSLDIAA